MMALIFELLSVVNFITASYYWIVDHDDTNRWLFFLLTSIIMQLSASRYEENE
jgi:hypothetical protein